MTGESVTESTARRLLARVAARQAEGRLPSLVAGLVRDGQLVWTGARGDARGPAVDEPAEAGPVDPLQVQYRIGSITKTLTAVLVLQLLRDGRVNLDAPASAVLGDVGYADRTLRSLLAHNGGLQSEPAGGWWERSPGVPWDDLVAGNDGSGAVFPALQQFHYSNLGYALLGEVVARVEGRPWWDCVRTQVLDPLGMARTSYLPGPGAAQGYSVHPYARTLVEEPATDTRSMAPAGQLWSTVTDLAGYAAFLLQGDPRVLALSELLVAAHPQAGDRDDSLGYAHGLGFQLLAGGSGMLVGHTGSMPGFLASCFVDRPRRTGCVVLANGTTGLATQDVARDLLEELERCEPTVAEPWRPTRTVPPEIADALGVWHWGNTPFVLTLDGEELVARRDGEERFRFSLREGRLLGTYGYHAGEELVVVHRPDGSVSHLDIATFVFTRAPYDPEAPIPGGHPG